MIVSKLQGGLANQIFQWAYGKSLSVSYNTELYLDTSFYNNQSGCTPREFSLSKFPNLDFKLFNVNTYLENPCKLNLINDESNFRNIDFKSDIHYYLNGYWCSERYFEDIDDEVMSWFKLKPDYVEQYETKLNELGIVLDDNTCVINFRGGEYRGIPKVLCRREYWNDSINHMLSINPNMKFVVITDDPECANWFMPFPIPVHHVDIGFDFYVVNQSKWTIISNSTFGWWAAWLNTKSNKIISPK